MLARVNSIFSLNQLMNNYLYAVQHYIYFKSKLIKYQKISVEYIFGHIILLHLTGFRTN